MTLTLATISEKFTKTELDQIIQKAGGTKHTGYEFGKGFNPGDSYLSDVYRFYVYGIHENGDKITVPLVVKAFPKNAARRKTFRSADFFRNEINFYTKVVPVFDEFQRRRKPKNPFNAIPLYYMGFTDGIHDYLALEDLSAQGYGNAIRQEGLDASHCIKILQTMGRFHALSLAIRDQDPETYSKLESFVEETYFAERFRKWYEPFLMDQIIVSTDAVTKEYGGTEIETKMQAFTGDRQKYYDTMISMTHSRNEYSVIGHGDGWTPNMLMTYIEVDGVKKPNDIKVIDYQLARLASPIIDVSFFIYSCTMQDVRQKHYDSFLKAYHDSLCEFLRDLGSDPEKVFPLSAFQSELRRVARFGVGMAMESIPLSIIDDADLIGLDTITGEDAVPVTNIWQIRPIKTKEGRLRLADTFKHATECGYLD